MAYAYRIRRVTLDILLFGVLCPAAAFAVRPRSLSSPILIPSVGDNIDSRAHRRHLITRTRGYSNRFGSPTALWSVSGGDTSVNGSPRLEKLRAFISKNFFLLGMVAAVSFARAFPHVRVIDKDDTFTNRRDMRT